MNEVDEIMHTVEHLQRTLEDLIVRGLRSAGTGERNALRTLGEEFTRIGAEHLAGRVNLLLDSLERGDRPAAVALLKTQASLRLFERILTLDVAAGQLSLWQATDDSEGEGDDEP